VHAHRRRRHESRLIGIAMDAVVHLRFIRIHQARDRGTAHVVSTCAALPHGRLSGRPFPRISNETIHLREGGL
jgi:hypothetical protein